MNTYKVTEKDLTGAIVGFPIEVVQKMLEYQVKQGNRKNVKVFQSDPSAGKFSGGFNWDDTKEKSPFWSDIISLKKFEVFFTKYPKRHYVYIYQDGTKNEEDIINTLIRYGGINELNLTGDSKNAIYYIRPHNGRIVATRSSLPDAALVETLYTEIQPEPSVKEYTMQEIADKLGINVNELRIKK